MGGGRQQRLRVRRRQGGPDLYLIDGGPIQRPHGASLRSFGSPAAPVDPGAATHGEWTAENIAHDAPHLRRTILETYPVAPEDWAARDRHMARAVRYAGRHDARVVNISMGKSHPTPRTIRAIRNNPDTLFLIGRPEGSPWFPADYKARNVVRVGNWEGAPTYVPSGSASESTETASVYAARVARKHPHLSAQRLKRAVRGKYGA